MQGDFDCRSYSPPIIADTGLALAFLGLGSISFQARIHCRRLAKVCQRSWSGLATIASEALTF